MSRRFRRFLPFSRMRRARDWGQDRLRWLLGAPFVLVFLAVAWSIFLVLVRADGWIPDHLRPHIGFVWNLWASDPGRAFLVAHLGLVVQHSWGQIVYVTLLLLLVGLQYEIREGTVRTLAMFYGACMTGVAALCVVILTTWFNGPQGWSVHLAQTSWSGASVGCFGLLGATVATARNPWPLLSAWIAFELTVEWTLVPGLAVTMHIMGFLFGFVASRWIHSGAPSAAEPGPASVAAPADDEPGRAQ